MSLRSITKPTKAQNTKIFLENAQTFLENETQIPKVGDTLMVLGSNDEIVAGTITSLAESPLEEGLIYAGKKVVPFSTALGTVLSNFEAGSNYQDYPKTGQGSQQVCRVGRSRWMIRCGVFMRLHR